MHLPKIIQLAPAALLLTVAPLGASVSVTEDFASYTANANLNGVTVAEGTGLSGSWSVTNASAGVGSRSGTLSYSGFDGAGSVTGGARSLPRHRFG